MLQIADFVFEYMFYLMIPIILMGIIGFLLLSFSSGAGFSLKMTMYHLSQLDFKNELTKIGIVLSTSFFLLGIVLGTILNNSSDQATRDVKSFIENNKVGLHAENHELALDLVDTLSLYLQEFEIYDGRTEKSREEVYLTVFSKDKQDSIYLILQKNREKQNELWVSYKLNKCSFKEWQVGKIPIYNPLLLNLFHQPNTKTAKKRKA